MTKQKIGGHRASGWCKYAPEFQLSDDSAGQVDVRRETGKYPLLVRYTFSGAYLHPNQTQEDRVLFIYFLLVQICTNFRTRRFQG